MLTDRMMKALSLCILLLLVAGVAACSAAPRKNADTYTSSTGAVTIIENDQESCRRSCDAEFNRCSETKAAQRDVGRDGQMNAVFGGGADCRDDMKACLGRCKSAR